MEQGPRPELTTEEQLDKAFDDTLFGGGFIVQGSVSGRGGRLLSGIRVDAHDRGLKTDRRLGQGAHQG